MSCLGTWGRARAREAAQTVQMAALVEARLAAGLRGVMMARCLARVRARVHLSWLMSTRVSTDTLTERTLTRGQKRQRKGGRCHCCSRMAWNWKGMANSPMSTSAVARLAM